MVYIFFALNLRVQVPNNHILTQNYYYNFYYPKPKDLIIGYMDPLGKFQELTLQGLRFRTGIWFRVLGF